MANNLLVDWLNKKKNNVQTNVLRKSATNTNNVTTPNLPIKPTTVRQTGLNLQKAQQPVQTRLNTVNSQTTPVWIQSNNPAFNNWALVNQNNQPSRFIGFQQPKLNTDLAGNIVNQEWNVLNTAQKGKSWATEMSKPVLNIPTQSWKISDYNTKQEKTYRDNEQVIKDFHYDVQKFWWMMNKEQISQLYPEFKGKEDIALMLQADILPLVQNNEFADMKKLSELYPELLPKQESIDADKYKKEQEIQENNMKFLKQRADKLLATKNTLSDEWKKYLQDMSQLAEFTQYIRDNYRLAWEPTDVDILKYAKDNFPEVKQIFDELWNIKLSWMDKAAIAWKSKNPFQNILAAVQEWLNDISTAYQENVAQPLTQMIESWELARRIGNTWIFNASTSDTLARASQIPVNMWWSILEWANKIDTAYTRISQWQDRWLDQVAQDLIHWWGGAIDIAFNATPLALATAVFEAANLTDAGQQITENTLWLFQEWITNILDWTFAESLWLSKDTYLASWYNSLDEETKSELTNEITVAVLHKWGKALKNLKIEWWVAVDAITNAFERWKGAAMFQAWIEKGLAGEWKATKWAVSRIFKEWMSEFKDALKENFRLYDTVVKNRRWDITSNMNTLPDNRTFREKAESKFNQAKETVNEWVNTVKEWVNNVVEWVQNIKPWEIIKNTAETVGKGVKATSDLIDNWKNAVTKWKNAVTNTISKWVNAVKETVNENIVEPYNKGRWKTNQLNTETWMQWIQQPQWQLASATDNKINWDNYTQKNTNSKPLNKVQLQLLQNNNRMNPKTADTFKERYGEDYGQFLADRWFTKSSEDNLKDLVTYKKDLLENKNELLNTVEWTFKDQAINDMIDHIVDYVVDTVDRKNEKRFKALQEKANNEWLTMSEINDMRQWYSYHVKTGFFKEQNAKWLQKATNIYDNLKDFLDKIWEENGLTSLREINKEIMKTQHIIGWVSYKMNAQWANNLFWLTDYVLWATITDPWTLAIFLAKQMAKQPTVKNAILNATVWRRENAKNRITKESKQWEKEKIQEINKEKREKAEQKKKEEAGRQLQSDLSKSDTKALPNKWWADWGKNILTNWKTIITDARGNSKVKGQISEIDKRVKKSDTSSSDKQSEPKKDNTLSTKERLKANWFEDIDTKWINLDNIDVKKMSEILNKSRDYRLGKDENGEYRVWYGDWTPKEKVNGDEAQLLMNIRDKKTPKEIKWYTWDKALTGAKLWYNKPTKNVVTEKAGVTTKSEPEMYDWLPVEQDEWGKFVRKSVEWLPPIKQYIWQWDSKPVAKSGWNAFWLKEQKGSSSRINTFTNVIKKIVDKYENEIDNNTILIEKEPYLPLEIKFNPDKKELIVRHINMWYDDPAIKFSIYDDWKLHATGVKLAFMEQYMWNYNWSKIRDTDELISTRAVNLEDQILWERNIDEDTGVMREKSEWELEPKTTTEITWEKNVVTSKATETEKPKNLVTNRPVDNSSITWRFRNLTLQDYKEMQKYQWVENQLINGDEEWYITGKIKAELLNQEKPLIPNAEIDESEFYPVNYDDLKELVDKKKEIQDAERKLMKKNDDNLSQQIEDLRYGYDNEMLPNLWIYEVEDVDKAVSIIEKAMQDAHFQFFKDKEWIKPLVDKYWEYWKVWDVNYQNKVEMDYLRDISNIDMNETPQIDDIDLKSVDKKENTNIIGKNNSLTTKNNQNDTNLWRSQKTVWWGNWWNEWGVRNAVSNMQPNEQNQAWLQRASDTNGNGQLNTSREQADISWNGLTAWSESTRLTVGQQRKINEDSRNILEKHNFSTSRSDYTPEELNTLFKYSWNWGVAKAWDKDIKGTRYEFYTPKSPVQALQRWIQKYSDFPIESVEDPTAWIGNMVEWYWPEVRKVMYEINKVSWTIAKLRFPEAKVWIGEKDGDFQRRYLNYQWQKAYDTPRDWGNNVDGMLINAPFGQRITIKDEPKIKTLEDYFTKRAIEHDLKDWWVVWLLMPSRWLKAWDSYTKQRLADNTEFLDAYRLPAGVFSYTDVGTDLIILKKKKWANNNLTKVVFYDDNYFIANPDKVLWVEKQRTWRHGMETYIDWDPKVIDTLWQDTDILPSKMNAITDTTKKTAVTAKSAPVENKPKNLVTNPPKEDVKFTPTETTDKSKAEKKTTTRKSKNAKQTISKWDKTDVGTYTVNWNEKAYDYQDATDADWFIDRSRLSISPAAVADWVELLNYIDWKIQTDYLYFSWNIYAKLKQLEKDKPQMSDAQYKKQKEWLEAILPSKLSVWDITWSPTDKALMDQETDVLYKRRDPELREEVDEKMTIKNAFKKRLSDLPSSQFQWTDTSYWKIRDYIDWKRWSSERLTKRYSETDEEFEARKKAKKAEEEVKKQATKERAKTFFNDFIKEQLSPEIQNKITESYNTRLRAVVKPDYKNMPLSVKNMSATFHWKPLKIDPVQIEWINAMLSKGTMLIAHWVGYGKTLEWVVATVASLQKWWTKKPLFIVPKWTREDWIKTTHDLFPNQEIVDLWGLTVDDIKRLKRDLWNDVKNWIKDWQVAIITHNWFDNKINFKKETQNSLESDLRDVMDNDNNTARQEDSLAENIQNIAETVNAKKDTKKLKWIKATLSDKYGDELLEELDQDLEKMSEVEFVENFVSKAEWKFKEEELRKDAHDMYETKPIYIEDLGIDHITIDEVHNYKNIFTSAKSNYKKWEWPEEVNPYGKISGSSSARGRKMFATAQYILKNNGWRWVFSLSATPFNNQPIEVYNMLSLHAYNRLVEKWIQNINSFFDYFANFRSEWISNPLKKWWWEFGEVMKDFNNLPEMQRLVGEYIDYVWDNPNLVRPEKRMKKVILTPSDMQREIQQRLQQEEKRMNANWEWDSVLPIYNDMRLNIISPYLTSYWKLYDAPTWQEFIESSPKLKFAVDTIKALRDEGQNDWVFIYMPLWVEYHSLLKEAIENMVGKDRVKVWIINWNTTGSETVDWEKVEKRIAIADRFRKWELNVLIWWRNTSEWINLQDNWFITINTLIWWNPTEITQLNGRIHRQWNLRDHVIELLPLLTDWADIMMMQKYDEKANRINNIFESQGRTFNLEELDPEEEKMALNTDPVRKAELSIDMDKKRIQRDIQKLSSQNGTLKEIVTKMPKEETIKEQQERISKAQEELKQINEWMKALDQDSSAYRTLESQRDYTERNIKWEKERLKALEKDKTRAEARMQQYAIDTIDGVNQRISENDAKLDDLIEQEKNLQNELKERIEKYTKEQEEWRANMKTPEDYIEELKEDFRSKKIFADREELKSHLEEQKAKKNVIANDKNKITSK